MLKRSLASELIFLGECTNTNFEVVGDTPQDLFVINIYRGTIQRKKVNFGARIKKNNILLLELHLSPTNVHFNPDGEKIIGSHWHIYTEEYGILNAYPASDITSDDFVENTIAFLNRFNVIDKPTIQDQLIML